VTLLVAALIPDAMILVSDQRLTNPTTGEAVTDRANKAIADLRSASAFAYTGIAQIGTKPTDDWIMEAMSEGSDPTDSLRCLREAGTREFARLPWDPPIKRLAVIGIGWGILGSGAGNLEPYIVRISNFDGGDHWLPAAGDRFTVRWFYPLRRGGVDRSRSGPAVGAWTAGQDLPKQQMDRLIRQIKNGLRRTDSLSIAARLIAEEVRSFTRVNPAVGKGLVIVSVPKPRRGVRTGIYSSPPPVDPRGIGDYFKSSRLPRDEINFLYLPSELSAPAASYGPLVLDEGMQFKGIEVWAETPPWWSE